MAALPKITLDQWRTLVAVVEAGGYAQAADQIHKSQSTLTYAVQKLERLLTIKVFEIQGRKAVLTPAGQVLYRRGKTLLQGAERWAMLYLIFADRDGAGPGVLRIADIIRTAIVGRCPKSGPADTAAGL